MKNYYQILGLPKFASLEEVKTEYRKLVKQYHPDVNKDESAKGEFLAIQEAFEAMQTEELKLTYDRKLKRGYQKKRTFRTSRTVRPSIRLKRQLNQIRIDIGNDPNFGHFELAHRLQAIFTPDFIHYFAVNSTEIEKTEAVELALEFIQVIRNEPAALEILTRLKVLTQNLKKLTRKINHKIWRQKITRINETKGFTTFVYIMIYSPIWGILLYFLILFLLGKF